MGVDGGHLIPATTGDLGDAALDEIAAEIRGYAASAMLEFASTVGRIVLDRFYGGDLDAWRHHGSKHTSLRRLAEKLGDDAHLSATSLYRCVAIRLVLLRLGSPAEYSRLSARHVTAVLPLQEPEQRALLHEACVGGWSARELERRVRQVNGRASRGRPPMPTLVRAIRNIDRIVTRDVLCELDRARELDRAAIENLYGAILRIRERLDHVQTRLSPKAHRGEPVGVPAATKPRERLRHRGAIGHGSQG